MQNEQRELVIDEVNYQKTREPVAALVIACLLLLIPLIFRYFAFKSS
jgi:hypothetical protein